MYREDCATPSPLRANCAAGKGCSSRETGRLGVWTNHVKISVVASENALQPNEPIASHPRAFGLGNGHGVVCAVASGLGGKVTVYIRINY